VIVVCCCASVWFTVYSGVCVLRLWCAFASVWCTVYGGLCILNVVCF